MLLSLFFVFLLLPILPVSPYTFTPTEIRDLESTTNLISQEATSWIITNKASSSPITDCAGSFILGGPGVITSSGTYSRTYSSIASHNNIFYSFSFWILDLTFLDGNIFSIYFNNALVGTWNGAAFLLTVSSNYCGQSQVDHPNINLSGTFPHQGDSLTIKIQSLLGSASSASFGFRDVSLLFTTSNPVPSASACQFGNLLTPNSCLCPAGQTGSGSILGGCSSCASGCGSCITGSSTCTSCPEGSSFNGVTCFTCDPSCDQCTGPLASDCIGCTSIQFLAWDNTCKSSCDPPYVSSTKNGKQICDLPCTGSSPFYWNSACYASCPDPLVPDTTTYPYKTCKSPCGTSLPVYNVGLKTCVSSCNLPERTGTFGDLPICKAPCDDPNYFSYWDNTCKSSCDLPLVKGTSGYYKTCSLPCLITEYYHTIKKTCVASCDLPERKGAQGDLKLCNSPCDDLDDFYYWDKSCKSSCPDPFVKDTTTNPYKTCSLPCATTEYYHLIKKTCVPSCDLPERKDTQGDLEICDQPCDNSGDFSYWNNTCDSSCISPLVKGTTDYYKTCSLPCPTASLYYYTSNKNCQASCTPPNIPFAEGDLKTCSPPCSDPDDFFYWTRTCQPSCPPPLVQSVDSFSKKYCNLPCDPLDFLYQDDSCKSECNPPLIPGSHPSGLQLCNMPCPLGQFLVNGTVSDCRPSCDSPSKKQNVNSVQVCIVIQKPADPDDSPPVSPENLNNIDQASSATAAVTSLLSAGNPTALFIIALADLMKYIRYIDVQFPAKVEKMFEGDLNTLLSVSTVFNFDLSDHINTTKSEQKLPHVFQKREISPSFLINEFDEVVFMLICILIGLILFPIHWFISRLTKSPRVNAVIQFISSAFRWNFFLLFFFGNFDDITLFSIIQFHGLAFKSPADIFSFFLCLGMISFGGFILWKTVNISKKTLAVNNKVHPLEEKEDFEEIHKGYKIMFEPYKDRVFVQRGHLFFFTIRIILCYVIIGVLYQFPITQMVLLTLINIAMIAYVAVLKPMKETLNMVESLVFELLLFVVNISVLIYTIIDKRVDPHARIRYQIGSVIVVTNLLVRLVSLLFVLYSLITEAYALIIEKFPWIKQKISSFLRKVFPCLYNKSAKVMDLESNMNMMTFQTARTNQETAAKTNKYRYSNQETAATPSPVYPKKKKNKGKVADSGGSTVYIGEKSTSNLLRLKDPTIILGNDYEENMPLGVLTPGQGSVTERILANSTVQDVSIMTQEKRKSNQNLKNLLVSEFALELTNAQSNQSNQSNQLPLTKAGSIENNSLLQQNYPGGVFDPFESSFQNTARNSLRIMSVGDVTPRKSPSLSNLLQGSESSRTLQTLNIWKLPRQISTDSEGSNSGTSNLLVRRFMSNELTSPMESKEDLTDRDIVLKNTEDSRRTSLSFVNDHAEKRNKRVNRRLAGLTENLKIEKQKSEQQQAKQEQQIEAGGNAAWDKQVSVKTGGRRTRARLSTIIEAPKVVSLEEVASPQLKFKEKKKKKSAVNFKFGSKDMVGIDEEK